MAVAGMPPATGNFSKTVGRKPALASHRAADMPAGPAPMTATRALSWAGAFSTVEPAAPCVSATKRLTSRMATGSSTSWRRQLASQGWWQIRPQTAANGRLARMMSIASPSRPSAAASM